MNVDKLKVKLVLDKVVCGCLLLGQSLRRSL